MATNAAAQSINAARTYPDQVANGPDNEYITLPKKAVNAIIKLAELPREQWGKRHTKVLMVEDTITELEKLSRASWRTISSSRPKFSTESVTTRPSICRHDVVRRLMRLRDFIVSLAAKLREIPLVTKTQVLELAKETRLATALYREYQQRFRKAESRLLCPGPVRYDLAAAKAGGSILKAQAMVYCPATSFAKDGGF